MKLRVRRTLPMRRAEQLIAAVRHAPSSELPSRASFLLRLGEPKIAECCRHAWRAEFKWALMVPRAGSIAQRSGGRMSTSERGRWGGGGAGSKGPKGAHGGLPYGGFSRGGGSL